MKWPEAFARIVEYIALAVVVLAIASCVSGQRLI